MAEYFKAKIVNPNSNNFGRTVWTSKTIYDHWGGPKMRTYYEDMVDGKPTNYLGRMRADGFEEVVEPSQQRVMDNSTPTLLDFVKNSAGDNDIFYVVNEVGDSTTEDRLTYEEAVEELMKYDGRAYITAVIAQSEKVVQPYS